MCNTNVIIILKGKYREKIFSLFSVCFCRYMPLKTTQKVVLTKTYFSKRYELTKNALSKHFLCGRGSRVT